MNRIVLSILAGFAFLVLLMAGLVFYAYRTYTTRSALLASPPAHGVKFTCELDSASAVGSTNLISEFREAVRNRFAREGWRIHFEQASPTKAVISAKLADSQQIEAAKKLLAQQGVLEFRLVHKDSDDLMVDPSNSIVPLGYEILSHEQKGASGPVRIEKMVVRKKVDPGLTGNVVKSAFVSRDSLGNPEILVRFRPEAATAFATVTGQNIGRRLAIILDGKLMTAPVIRTAIEGGSASISGQFQLSEAAAAAAVAAALESPLPASVRLLETKSY